MGKLQGTNGSKFAIFSLLFVASRLCLRGPIARDTAILVTIAAIPHTARYSLREDSTPPKSCDPPPLDTKCNTPDNTEPRRFQEFPHYNTNEGSF